MSDTNKETLTLNDLESIGEDFEIDNILIPINTAPLFNEDGTPKHSYDTKEFTKGVKEASFYAGFFSALQNACITEESIMTILDAHLAKELLPTQIEAQKEIAKIEIEKAETLTI